MKTAIAALLLCPTIACAATKYVRGIEADYGAEDGTTYETAYDGLGAVVLNDGDYLYVCGGHTYGNNDNTLTITSKNNVTVDFNCPSDQGYIIAAGFRFTSGWTGPDGNGAYSRSYTGTTGMHVVEDTTRLIRKTDVPDGTWAAGTFSQVDTTLYYKPSSGVATDHVVYTAQTDAIVITGSTNITLIDPDVRGLAIDACIDVSTSDNVTITRPVLKWCQQYAIKASSDSDYLTVTEPTITESGNGIYLISTVDANNNDYFVIRGDGTADIHDLDQAGYYDTVTDNHAVGIQGGSYGEVSNLEIYNLRGSCVTWYTFAGQEQSYNETFRVKCHDVSDTNAIGSRQVGIQYENTNTGHDPNDTVYNLVYANEIDDVVEECLSTKSQKPTTGFSWAFYNNTVSDCGVAFTFDDFADGNTGFEFKNNISYNSTLHVVHSNKGGETLSADNIVFANNTWYSDGAGKFEWISTASEYATWQGSSSETNGLLTDPVLTTDFKLKPSSPAWGTGAVVEPCLNFTGGTCLSVPSRGAHQHGWILDDRPGWR